MHEFDPEIVATLNARCKGNAIEFVGLGRFDFQISFDDIHRIQAFEKVVFEINNQTYVWTSGPSDAPAWQLLGQIPIHFALISPIILKLTFQSGDSIEFHTSVSQNESVLIDLGPSADNSNWRVF